ncbi:flagellar protein export ATPase FliI [Pedomonas mirosovicensis]|uniref:flagellar protein export ATPase FliI n=1 Tax=Pedomonas mirosovicensis TaxID=2908641 RepID=UPI00216A048A|nr:flagellar protein export ATPase FliI [Pedomonas mirosovicensis]MCH8685896.1 flagellar protein export ATPase FliI [Pedomonas mirosovicensis]
MYFHSLADELKAISRGEIYGRLSAVKGLMVEVAGIGQAASVGARLGLLRRDGAIIQAEVVGFRDNRALCLPYGALDGVGVGSKAYVLASEAEVRPSHGWLGRVVNGLGEPVDGKGALPRGPLPRLVRGKPPAAHARDRVGSKIDLGVRALDVFAPCCKGQRLGIFAGSGVGKSVLLSMLARYTDCDVAIIGLIGERGREVQEFLEDDLGPEGLARSIVVVATSDEPALMRRQAAYLTFALAEHFRDQGQHVLCMMDSVTRFAMAQREIGLASGEPPASKGYTPTVFAELPKLLERAGPGTGNGGAITGLFTVLVDGDDHNEPVADAVRGILDGHIVMQRAIAERGRYPAINVLKSVSRTLPAAHTEEENRLMRAAKAHLSVYADMEEMIRLGAYRRGSNPEVDAALTFAPKIEAFLNQRKGEHTRAGESFQQLAKILG